MRACVRVRLCVFVRARVFAFGARLLAFARIYVRAHVCAHVCLQLKTALIIHGIYFTQIIPGLELSAMARQMFAKMPASLGITYPKRTGNMFWMTSYLAASLFFVCATFFFLMSKRERVPRWTLIVPWAQCAYNMKNDLMWVGFGPMMSPKGKRITGFVSDTVLILVLYVIYIHHFFSADAIAPAPGR